MSSLLQHVLPHKLFNDMHRVHAHSANPWSLYCSSGVTMHPSTKLRTLSPVTCVITVVCVTGQVMYMYMPRFVARRQYEAWHQLLPRLYSKSSSSALLCQSKVTHVGRVLYIRHTCELHRSPRVSASNRRIRCLLHVQIPYAVHSYICISASHTIYLCTIHAHQTGRCFVSIHCIDTATVVIIPGQVQMVCYSAVPVTAVAL